MLSKNHVSFNAPENSSSITFKIPSNDCYVVYGISKTTEYGVSIREKSITTITPSTNIERIFEAVTGNNNVIGLYYCKNMKNTNLTINANTSCYRASVTCYY